MYGSSENITQDISKKPQKLLQCSLCPKSVINMRQHKRIYHEKKVRFECSFCQKLFLTKANAEKHMASIHNGIKVQCPICGNNFSEKSNLNKHIKSVHQALKPYKCEICDKSFSVKSVLTSHITKIHERNYISQKCPLCNFAFTHKVW